MTLTRSLLATLNRPVCETTLSEALAGLSAAVALVGMLAGFLAVCANA